MDEILSIAGVSNRDLDAELPGSSVPPIQPGGSVPGETASMLQQLLDEQRDMIQRSGDQSYREAVEVRKLINGEFPSAANEQKQRLLSLLAGPVTEDSTATAPPGIAVIVITRSELLSTMIRSICYQEGVYAVSTDNIASLDINIRLLLCQTLHLVIFLDVPHGDAAQDTIQICRDLQRHPQASVVLAACSRFWDKLGLQALGLGIRSIIPRPCTECSGDSSLQQAVAFSSGFGAFLRTLSSEYSNSNDQRFFTCISRLRSCTSRTEISVAVLDYLIEVFERAIVFLVTDSGLMAEYSFGVKGAKNEGVVTLSNLQIPLDDQEIFEDVVKTGQMYYGFYSDSTWPHDLYRLAGRPYSPEVLLFPFIRANTVAAFIYADFGSQPASTTSLHHIDALLQYTTAQISVSAYRQKLKTMQDL
jgi:hypothetical protein